MYTIIWKFEVKPGSEQKFEEMYASTGAWVQLFRRAGKAYLGTELLKDVERPGMYVTVDRWESHEAYEKFLKRSVNEYKRLDDQCEALTTSESKIGDLVL